MPFLQFGTHRNIQFQDEGIIHVVDKAELGQPCENCGCNSLCCLDASRSYFYVYENGYTYNMATACCCLTPNCCCTGSDHIYQTYFDRGWYDQQSCCWKIGCFSGDPVIVANDIKSVCCCQDCTLCDWNGYCLCCVCFPICGLEIPDRVRILPCTHCCWCVPTRACFLQNCFGLVGPKTGEPLCLLPVMGCLRRGSAESLAQSLNETRKKWKERVRDDLHSP